MSGLESVMWLWQVKVCQCYVVNNRKWAGAELWFFPLLISESICQNVKLCTISGFDTYSGIIFSAISEESRCRELLADDDRWSVDQHLTNSHAAAGRVIKRKWTIENVLVPKVGDFVYCGCDVNVSRVCYDGRLRQSSRAWCVDVKQLIVMTRLLNFVGWWRIARRLR